MKREIELLAPGGDVDSIKAAILAGADAVYCGLDKFNARNRATNITLDSLPGIVRLAHENDCEIFLTVNIILVESEFPTLINLLNKLVNIRIDGIIIQDFGLFYLLSKYFPTLKIHASTQLTTHNEGQVKFLSQLGATRVNLSRELNLDEITSLSSISHDHNVLTEVFVHGSNCISFSGLCYMSSVQGGNSGNRGRCSQPCRDQYLTTAEGKDFPLNIKDNSAYSDLRALYEAGVDSIKIEGRIKKYHYVYTVVDTWRKQLNQFYAEDTTNSDSSELRKVFNRDFSNSFLQGEIGRSVFIDNPRDNSALHRSEQKSGVAVENLLTAKKELYELKTDIITNVKDGIDKLSVEKAPLLVSFSGESGTPLSVAVTTPDESFVLLSDSCLVTVKTDVNADAQQEQGKKSRNQGLETEMLLKRFKALNDTAYFIDELEVSGLVGDLIVPFKELTTIKNKILYKINGLKESVKHVEVPISKKHSEESITPSLSVLISSEQDLKLCDETEAEVYFQLPNTLSSRCSEFVTLFKSNRRLIPWFPAVLIGEDYDAAIEFLQQVKPEHIVTNNSGVAYAAYQAGIAWTAGPYMNIVNSYSLLCLKENFNCSGAFLSNEINQGQLKRIKKPDDFSLSYSISHPIVLMTTRVCMFHQVTGCKKNIVDDKCMQRCEKSSFITNLKQVSFFIDKAKGEYHSVYNEANFLNTGVVADIPNLFSRFFIDLREIKTGTQYETDKLTIVKHFENLLAGNDSSATALHECIQPSTYTQYVKGI